MASTPKIARKSIKSSQEIARKSGRYKSTTEANKAGKKSARSVHKIVGIKGLKKHPPKKHYSGKNK